MFDLKDKLLLAMPKKGRLHEPCKHALTQAGIKFHKRSRLDIALCSNMEVAIIFLPAKDIAIYVAEGEVDLGITGQDVIKETSLEVQELLKLGFGNCKLCIQAPVGRNLQLEDLIGARIATSFPTITSELFKNLTSRVETQIRTIAGSVEVACSLGLADAVVDLVETGETMKEAGMEIIHTILKSEAVLISNPERKKDPLVIKIKKRLEGVVTASKYSMIEYNIKRDYLKAGEKLTPGQTSPTISPLEDPDWVAVKSLILKSEANDLIDQLDQIGANDILVYHLDNCRV